MKKFFSMIAVFAAMFAFASCTPEEGTGKPGPNPDPSGGKLATPVLTETHTETSFTVAWEAVTNADSYMVNLDGKNYTTAECSYTFENLNAGEYTVRVKAKGAGYEDSDNAKIVISLTGLTSADWFVATAKPAELNEAEGYGPYNAIEFTWKGTGVQTLSYGLYYTESLLGVSDADIKAALTSVSVETINMVNSEDGLTSVLGPVAGGTSYTMCVLVTNSEKMEYFAKVEVATESAESSDAAKAWIGTWTVNSTQKYSIDDKGQGTVIDAADTFTVEISASTNDPNEVVIDGLSVLGLGDGWVTYGVVEEDQLYILNGTNLGVDQSNEFAYYWVGWYDFGLSIDAYPSNIVTMNGDSATSTNKFNLYDENNNPVAVQCFCSDVFGVTEGGQIMFFIEAFPGVYRTGDMTWTKAAAATSLNANAANLSVSKVLPSSVVVAM